MQFQKYISFKLHRITKFIHFFNKHTIVYDELHTHTQAFKSLFAKKKKINFIKIFSDGSLSA